MSDNLNNNISSILLNEEKDNNKNDNQIKSKINDNDSNNISNNLNNSINSKIINNSSMIYSYPICLQNEKDPLDDFKLKVIKARNKGSDTFLKNYLKFNFSKNDINSSSSQLNNKSKSNNNKSNNKLQGSLLENNKNNLFITEEKNLYNKLPNNIKNVRSSNLKDKAIDVLTKNRPIMKKSNSEIFNPYSQKSINHYKTLYLIEMEKRGHQYNKRRMASLQRIALHNFSLMNKNDNHYVNGSIPTGKSD